MMRTFKSNLTVDLPFIRSGQTIELETDEIGVPKDKEARKRYKDGGIIEVKINTVKLEKKSLKGENNE